MDTRCGDCGATAAPDATTCAACGRTFGTRPRRRTPGLIIGAMIVAAIEVAVTVALFRGCTA